MKRSDRSLIFVSRSIDKLYNAVAHMSSMIWKIFDPGMEQFLLNTLQRPTADPQHSQAGWFVIRYAQRDKEEVLCPSV